MKKRILIITVILSVFLSGSYYDEEIIKEFESINSDEITENLSDETLDILEELDLKSLDFEKIQNIDVENLFMAIIEKGVLKIKNPFKTFFTVLVSLIVCAVIRALSNDFCQTGTVVNAVSSLTAASIFLIPIKDSIVYSTKIIEECSNFMLSFIPIYSSAIIASGYVSSAAGFRTLMLTAVTFIVRLINEIVVPLMLIYFAMSVAGCFSSVNISEISKSIKSFALWIIGIFTTVFSGIMGLGTIISSSGDSAFSKTAKFLIGGAIPIVGSTVSDALSTVKSCLTIAKNFLGVYAIIVILVIFLPPILDLVIWRICLSLASAAGSIFENKSITGLISSASAVVGIMLGLVAFVAVLFIFSVSIMLMAGGGI